MNIGLLFCGISYGIMKDRDFDHCYPNIEQNIIQPLEQRGDVVYNYFCTYDNPRIQDLEIKYNPKKTEVLNFNESNQLITRIEGLNLISDEALDFIIMCRFDVHYNMSITTTNIDFEKFNIVSREGNGYWTGQKWTGDTFYAFPKKFLSGFYDACQDLLNITSNYDRKHMHNLYPYLAPRIGENNINFMFDTEQLSGHVFNSICTKYYVDMHRNNFTINQEVLDRFS